MSPNIRFKQLLQTHTITIFLFGLSLIIHLLIGFGHIRFGQDSGRDLLIMQSYEENNQWIVGYGPKASVGDFYLPPFYYQLHNIVSRLTNQYELSMMWVILLVESFTPVILYLILRLMVNQTYSIIASVLYIFSPLVLNYSTSMWNPNMIPFFSTLALWGWLNYLIRKNPSGIIIGALGTIISIHLHYQGVVLLLFPLSLFIRDLLHKNVKWRFWLMSILLAVVSLLPYFIAEQMNDWHNTREIISYFSGEHSRTFDRVSKPGFILTFLPSFSERLLIGYNISGILIGRAVFWLGMLWLSYLAWTRKLTYRWVWWYFLTIFIMLRIYKGDKLDYYMSMLYIMPFVLLSQLLESLNKIFIPLALIIAFLSGNYLQSFPKTNALEDLRQSIEFINTHANSRQVELLYHNKDDIPTFEYGLYKYRGFELGEDDILADVCRKDWSCGTIYTTYCAFHPVFEQSVIKKVDNNYQFINSAVFGDYYIITGQLTNN